MIEQSLQLVSHFQTYEAHMAITVDTALLLDTTYLLLGKPEGVNVIQVI